MMRYAYTAPIGRALRIAAENYERQLIRTYGERYEFRMLGSERERLAHLRQAASDRQQFIRLAYAS